MTNSTHKYDPYAHANELGLSVIYQTLRTCHGLYIPDRKIIMLRPRMKASTERCVLAHEIGHHIHGHRRTYGAWSAKQEKQADQTAALNLIKAVDLDAARRWSRNPNEWCNELGVTADLLLAYLNTDKHLATTS